MDHYDRMQKTRQIIDKTIDEIIENLFHVEGSYLLEKIDLTLKLGELIKILDLLEDGNWDGKE